MPQRILRDWTDSHAVNGLSFQAEVLFTRLIMKADDFGRFHAHPTLLNSLLFPLRTIRDPDIARWLAECATAGLIAVYGSGSKVYLEIVNFGQRTRDNSVPKFPGKDDAAILPHDAAERGTVPPNSYSYSETYSETKTKAGGEPPGFVLFWQTWPAHKRKANRKGCLAAWHTGKCETEADAIARHVAACKRSEDWAKSGGAFVPAPLVYLHQRRWEAPPPPPAESSGDDIPPTPPVTPELLKAAYGDFDG